MTKSTLKEGDEIFSNGVFLKAMKVTINNKQQIRWIATNFEDSSFFNGEEIEVYTFANKVSELIKENED